MKMKKEFLMMAALVAMASSCSNNDPVQGAADPSNEIIVATEVRPMLRAGHTSETMSEFGLIITAPDAEFCYNNKRMVGGALAGWTTDETLYWQNKNNAHSIIAYAPYVARELDGQSKIDVKVKEDQTTAEAVKVSDFIAMKHADFVPANDLSDGKLMVRMEHVLSKVFVELTYPEAYASPGVNPVSNMTVGGMLSAATFDFGAWDGAVSTLALNGNSDVVEIKPFELSHDEATRTVVYEFISIPQEAASINITFKAGNVPYTWKYDDLKLEGNKSLTIQLVVEKTGVQFDGDVTVGEWGNGGTVDGKPEEGADPYTIEEVTTGKAAWTIEYGTVSMPFGPYDQLFNNNVGDGWFSQVVDGYENSPNTGNPYCVIDLGEKTWLAGVGMATGPHDVMPKTVEFYISPKELIENVITEDELNKIKCYVDPNGDSFAASEDYKTYLEKINTADAEMAWIHVGKIEIGALSQEWGNREYHIDFDDEKLAEKLTGRWLKVEMTFFSAEEHAVLKGDRAKISEIFLRKVTQENGEPVVF